mmetsp:Transcript_41201/g.119315  ORF Transcript_41201/g.119315 Transcript_41201/m.119315 type:complete len:179 (+) Transcript_41201:95-631(+)
MLSCRLAARLAAADARMKQQRHARPRSQPRATLVDAMRHAPPRAVDRYRVLNENIARYDDDMPLNLEPVAPDFMANRRWNAGEFAIAPGFDEWRSAQLGVRELDVGFIRWMEESRGEHPSWTGARSGSDDCDAAEPSSGSCSSRADRAPANGLSGDDVAPSPKGLAGAAGRALRKWRR